MLITEKVEIKWNINNKKHYENLGYEYTGLNTVFIADIKDVTEGSSVIIEYKCDMCGEVYKRSYKNYNKLRKNSIIKIDTCFACKKKKTRLVNLAKYNTEWFTQTEEFKQKTKETINEKYGVDYYSQTQEYKDKKDATCLEKYGDISPSRNEKVKEKVKTTCLEKYGKEYYFQTQEKKEKSEKTLIEKYGVSHPMYSEEIKQRMKDTCVQRYGVDNPTKNKDVLQKVLNSLHINDKAPSSNAQRICCNYLNGELNYPIDKYLADIYIKDDNVVVEWDGSGHNFLVKTNKISEVEFLKKEKERENLIISKGYKIIRFISLRDKIYDKETMLDIYKLCKDKLKEQSIVYYNIE